MNSAFANLSDHPVDTEFVASGVDADLVGAEGLRNRQMLQVLAAEDLEVAAVVDTFFEISDKAGCETYPLDAEPTKLRRHQPVLEWGRHRRGLVDRDFNLERSLPHRRRDVAVDFRGVGQRCSVFDPRPQHILGRWHEGQIGPHFDDLACIPTKGCTQLVLEVEPRQVGSRILQLQNRHLVGGIDHMIARVDGEHREARRRHKFDVGFRLEVVGVSAPGLGPSLFEHCPGGGVQNLVRGPLGALELADRLLGENHLESTANHRAQMRLAGDPEAVAETEGVIEAQGLWPGAITHLPHRHRVRVVEVAEACLDVRFHLPAIAREVRRHPGFLQIDRKDLSSTPVQRYHQGSPRHPANRPSYDLDSAVRAEINEHGGAIVIWFDRPKGLELITYLHFASTRPRPMARIRPTFFAVMDRFLRPRPIASSREHAS